MHTREKIQKNMRGFMLPMIIVMFGACVTILLAIMQYVVTVATFSNDIVYRQVALTAAKSALEYGKEQFDGDAQFDIIVDPATDDTNGNAVADSLEEKTLFTNDKYRVTYQLKIVPDSTSLDGRSKRTQGIGYVYLPSTSDTPRFKRTINSELVRSQIVTKDPSDFSPLAWYDASCNASIDMDGDGIATTNSDAGCQFDTVLKDGTDSAAGNPISLREESAAGIHCGGEPSTGSSSDRKLSFNTLSECGEQQQLVGLVFNLKNKLPKDSVIVDAYIQFSSDAQDAAQVAQKIYAIDTDHVSPFTSSGSYELSGAPRTNGDHDTNPDTKGSVLWDSGPWTNTQQSSYLQRTNNLKHIVQEVINRPGWQPSNDGSSGNIGFLFEYVSGPGTRRAKNSPITLNITYAGYTPAEKNDTVKVWRDRSGNGFHMTAISDTARPTRSVISQEPTESWPNGKPMVKFSTTTGMKAEVPVSAARTSNVYTAFSVMSIMDGTDKTTGHGSIVSFFGDGTNNDRYSPFWRHPVNTFHSWDEANMTDENKLCMAVDSVERLCTYAHIAPSNSYWALFSAREGIIERDSILRRSGHNSTEGQTSYTTMTLNSPYRIAIGADAEFLTPRSSVEIAEVILYDRALTCPQIESVEQYLAEKWGFNYASFGEYNKYSSDGCPENNIPVF